MSTLERQKYKIASSATWELIRAAYLGGESAPALAERYGVSEAAIRKRITVEKWSKRDYAAALEARGLSLPVKAPAANFIDEGVVREEARRRGEAAAAAARDAEIDALIKQIAAEEEAAAMAEAMERRALAQAGAAMVQGKAKEAQALAALAEQMRKRAGAVAPGSVTPQQREGAPTDLSEETRADLVTDMFARAAFLAGAMVHKPGSAPAAFTKLVKEWRMINLGEDEADAEAAARRAAKAQEHYLSGSWIETMPTCIRERIQQRWAHVCADEEARLVEAEK